MIPKAVRRLIAYLARVAQESARLRRRSKAEQRREYIRAYARIRARYLRSL